MSDEVVRSGRATEWILLDASCVLNLYASGHMEEMLRCYPARFGVVAKVQSETLFVRATSGDADDVQEPVNLVPLIQSGLLTVYHMKSEENATFVAFAARLDDGEAETCAVAVHRRMSVSIDERKGRKVLAAQEPTITVYQTLDFVHNWATTGQFLSAEVASVLRAIRERARFSPNRNDPYKEWWDASISPA